MVISHLVVVVALSCFSDCVSLVSHPKRPTLSVRSKSTSSPTTTTTTMVHTAVPFVWSGDDDLSESSNSNLLLTSLASTIPISKAKMIVFDKDGTLGDDKASLQRWATHMTTQLTQLVLKTMPQQQEQLLPVLVAEFHTKIGWDPIRQSVLPSAPLAAGTWDEQIVTLQTLLDTYHLDPTGTLATEWHRPIPLHGADPPLLSNLRSVLLDCQRHGLILAVCTSDERTSTDQALANWNVDDLISYSICGDEVDHPKPSAEPLQRLCHHVSKKTTMTTISASPNQEGLSPQECIVVGDTSSDTGMAQNAKAHLCIGVLTGSSTAELLMTSGAHVVVPHVGYIPALLSAMKKESIVGS